MGTYIKWDDVVSRYKMVADIGGASSVGSAYIIYAEAEVEGMLSSSYTVPFSSNNVTVKDLCIDLTLVKALAFNDTKKSESIMKSVDSRVDSLLSGKTSMMTDSGDVLSSSGQGAIYSTTENYRNTFDMNDAEDSWVDPDMQEDEYSNRNT